jgi:hypothetical protein
MLGFKSFYNARRVLIGIELMQKIVKGQFRVPAHFGYTFHSICKWCSPFELDCPSMQQNLSHQLSSRSGKWE